MASYTLISKRTEFLHANFHKTSADDVLMCQLFSREIIYLPHKNFRDFREYVLKYAHEKESYFHFSENNSLFEISYLIMSSGKIEYHLKNIRIKVIFLK